MSTVISFMSGSSARRSSSFGTCSGTTRSALTLNSCSAGVAPLTIGARHRRYERCDWRFSFVRQRNGPADHRRFGREPLVLRVRGQFAMLPTMANDPRQKVETHGCQCAFPQLARRLALDDKAPVL